MAVKAEDSAVDSPKRIRTYSGDEALIEQRRSHIVEHSIRTFVKKGYARTSVNDILKACDMARGTMYHYVGSKDDIVYLIIQYGTSRLKNLIDSLSHEVENLHASDAVRKAIQQYYQHCDEMQDIIMFATREMVYLSEKDRQEFLGGFMKGISFFEGLLERGIKDGEFKIDHPRALAHDIVARANTWATNRWFLRRNITLEEYVKDHTGLLLRAISVDKGPMADC